MAKANSQPSPLTVVIFVLIAVSAVGFMIITLRSTIMGPGSTTTKATRNLGLSPRDDALSLQQDLNFLQTDPTADEEVRLGNE